MSDIKIDKSLARGLFRQAMRESGDLFVNGLDGMPSPDTEITAFCIETILKSARKKSFDPSAFRGIARTLKGYGNAQSERFHSVNCLVVPGSARKSFLEVAFANKIAANHEDCQFDNIVGYAFVKKDRFCWGLRQSFLGVNYHAVQRFIQRGAEIKLESKVVTDAVLDLKSRTGLAILLSRFVRNWSNGSVPIPYKNGLFLCETHGSISTALTVQRTDGEHFERWVPPRETGHPLLLSDDGKFFAWTVKTYVGPNELRPGQLALAAMLESVYLKHKQEIDLLSGLETVFHHKHQTDYMMRLERAAGRLDAAALEIIRIMRKDWRVAHEFDGRGGPDLDKIVLPSALIKKGLQESLEQSRVEVELGLADMGGAPFCYRDRVGFLPKLPKADEDGVFPPRP